LHISRIDRPSLLEALVEFYPCSNIDAEMIQTTQQQLSLTEGVP
jgi:hypothetical protein